MSNCLAVVVIEVVGICVFVGMDLKADTLIAHNPLKAKHGSSKGLPRLFIFVLYLI